MQKLPEIPVTLYPDTLPQDRHRSLLDEIAQSHLEMHQPYPRRLFTKVEHESWLRSYFDPFIERLAQDTGIGGLYVQQIFLGMELPDSTFLMHRSHPNIVAVAIYSPEDFPPFNLAVLTDSHSDTEDYLWGRGNYNAVPVPFRANEAIVVHNTDPRYHWGFAGQVGANTIKRSVWIYFGK